MNAQKSAPEGIQNEFEGHSEEDQDMGEGEDDEDYEAEYAAAM